MKIRIIVFLSSVLLLGVTVAALYKSVNEEWISHGNEYLDKARENAETEAVKEALAGASADIIQDRLEGYPSEPRVDRCRTCHSAIDDPNFVDGENPIKTHPPIPTHPWTKFGCTICHEGDGRALDKEHAHGSDKHANYPLLTGAYIQANCARCHSDLPDSQVPQWARGRDLFKNQGCVGCHTVEGLSKGKLGAELTMVGKKFHLPYLRESIEVPKANDINSVMPKFNLSKSDVTSLVIYLKSLRGRPLSASQTSYAMAVNAWEEWQAPPVPVSSQQGNASIDKHGCVSCHQLKGKDGKLAPTLDWEGSIRVAKWIVEHLEDPRQHTYGSNMPNFEMSDSERQAVAMHLTELKMTSAPLESKEKFEKFCVRCHGENGDARGVISHNLLPLPRQFTNAKFFNWLPESRAHNAILNSVPGTAMPPFKKIFTEAQTKELFDYVRKTFIKEGRFKPKKSRQEIGSNPVEKTADSVATGKEIFLSRCYGCHGKLGDGQGPNASEMEPRPRNLTSGPFFDDVDDARIFESITYGVVGTGMPPWDVLTEEQRWNLVNYVRELSKTKNR